MNALSKIDNLRTDLSRRFPERERVIDGCLAAVLAGEHVLLVGLPGTAKSQLVRSIAQAFGGTYFERLLTKFSTPDELFGPISLRALENDRFERVIAGKLPTVEFAFVDECFKSSSAILNSLLTLMNERLYHNDGPPIECPLITLFGASNELPESGDLDALFDRFLVRFDVQYLARQESMRSILSAAESPPTQFLTIDELRAAQAEVTAVTISEDTIEGVLAIRAACKAENITVSDRRWKRCLKIVRASAYLTGQSETSPDDLQVLYDMLWREPKEYTRLARIVSDNADPALTSVREVLRAITETSRKFNQSIATLQLPAHAATIKKHADSVLQTYAAQRALLDGFAAHSGTRTRKAIEGAIASIDVVISQARRSVPGGMLAR